ncbi:hypothetical protein GGX14DRAFT_558388 [Mycena pura]|uniref:Uncharacterized protein n=1 Tax=Mycena pura TaxID=153505 RepID=A0AAD6YKS7_9AGAR|nr:hypothetical protein GGX14DRAFT_558388 [Mycena pura]
MSTRQPLSSFKFKRKAKTTSPAPDPSGSRTAPLPPSTTNVEMATGVSGSRGAAVQPWAGILVGMRCELRRILRYTGCDVAIENRTYEVWSPNSMQFPFFFAGRTRDNIHFDPLEAPQYDIEDREWLPFARRPCTVTNTEECSIAFRTVAHEWDHGRSQLNDNFVTLLHAWSERLEMQALRALQKVDVKLCARRPPLPTHLQFQDLRCRSYKQAVDAATVIQRQLREHDAWITMVCALTEKQDSSPPTIWTNGYPKADEKYIGVFINDVSEDRATWLLSRRIPVFVVHVYGDNEIHRSDGTETQLYRGETAWEARSLRDAARMPYFSSSLFLERRCEARVSWTELPTEPPMKRRTPAPPARVSWTELPTEPPIKQRTPVPPRAAEHALKTETRSLYPGHVDWLVPPLVMEATPGTRWEKWELMSREDAEDDEEIFLQHGKGWRPEAEDILIWYDRQNHRELCVYESYAIPAGCCQVDVFGCPAPDVKYCDATGRHRHPSRWMYRSRAPCQQDKDRRASTPTRDDLPLLIAPPSFVPFAPLSPAPSSAMPNMKQTADQAHADDLQSFDDSSLVSTIDASRTEIEAGRHGQVHGPDAGVESTFEGSDHAGRLDPGQSNVLRAPDMMQTADQAHADDLQSSDDSSLVSTIDASRAEIEAGRHVNVLGAPVTSSMSRTVKNMDNMDNLRPDAQGSELPPGGKMEVELRLGSGGVGSHGEGKQRASLDDDMVSLGSCSEDEMLGVIANTEATLMEVDPPVAVVNGKPECSTPPQHAVCHRSGSPLRKILCEGIGMQKRRRSRSLSPAGVITPTLAEGRGSTASAEATNDFANVPLINRLTKGPEEGQDMGLFHTTVPSLVCQPKGWLKRPIDDVPDMGETPAKRPRQERIGRMAAWTARSLTNLLWFSDTCTANELWEEIGRDSTWTLDQSLNVPCCEDLDSCEICSLYLKHVKKACRKDDEDEEEKVSSDGERDKDSEEDSDGDGDSGLFNNENMSENMRKLFQLRDLLARENAFASEHNDPQSMGRLQGLMVGLHADKIEAVAKQEKAMHDRAAIEVEMKKLEQAHNELKAQHQQVLEELSELKQQSDQARLVVMRSSEPRLHSADYGRSSLIHAPETSGLSDTFYAMTMPTREEPPEQLARWLQFHELTNIKGIPICGPDWVVDLRSVRGHHEVMSRAPPKPRDKNRTGRKAHQMGVFAILNVLGVPEKYSKLLRAGKFSIAAQVKWEPLLFRDALQTDQITAQLLAEQGLSLAVANDTWLFCYNYIKSLAASEDAAAMTLLAQVEVQLVHGQPPPGINPPREDQFARRHLPNKRKALVKW